jgi:ATP-dependent DNA helicase RecG
MNRCLKNEELLMLLERLDAVVADDLETEFLEFKPWLPDVKDNMKVALEYSVCFANHPGGGVIVFGVKDRTKGRREAITGCSGYNLQTWRTNLYDNIRPRLDGINIEELRAPEGILLIVRVPRGPEALYGTVGGLFKCRIGKSCMPVDPVEFQKTRVAQGVLDWTAEPAEGIAPENLDPVEIARAKNVARAFNPKSGLSELSDKDFVQAIKAVDGGKVTRAGLLVLGRTDQLEPLIPQHLVQYTHEISDTKLARNDFFRSNLLHILERITEILTGPVNPEREVSVGLFILRISAFPVDVVREALLNAVTHRDYTQSGKVLVRHAEREMVLSNPGDFVGGVTTQNILRHEAVTRNPALAAMFQKLGLVETAGMGRRRIFIPMLSYGKRIPKYESDGFSVALHLYDGAIDERMAVLVAKWQKEGRDIGLDGLLLLSYLREHPFLDSKIGAALLQVDPSGARDILGRYCMPPHSLLERRGRKVATYHLVREIGTELLDKATYTRLRGVDPVRYREMVKQFVEDHGSITNKEFRGLFQLGDSDSAVVRASQYLKEYCGSDGFLKKEGRSSATRYAPRNSGVS